MLSYELTKEIVNHMNDIKGKRIYHTVPASSGVGVHHMEYNIMLGWMCSCKSYMYRKVCKHVIEMNERMNSYGECRKCKHIEINKSGIGSCLLWGIIIDDLDRFNCAAWEKKS